MQLGLPWPALAALDARVCSTHGCEQTMQGMKASLEQARTPAEASAGAWSAEQTQGPLRCCQNDLKSVQLKSMRFVS